MKSFNAKILALVIISKFLKMRNHEKFIYTHLIFSASGQQGQISKVRIYQNKLYLFLEGRNVFWQQIHFISLNLSPNGKRKRGGSSSNTSSCRNQNYFDDVLISSDLMINVSRTINVVFFYAIDIHYKINVP